MLGTEMATPFRPDFPVAGVAKRRKTYHEGGEYVGVTQISLEGKPVCETEGASEGQTLGEDGEGGFCGEYLHARHIKLNKGDIFLLGHREFTIACRDGSTK